MKRETIGSYFERSLMLMQGAGFDEIGMGGMDHAAVLLWLGDADWSEEELEKLIARFVNRGTLNLTISGERAGESFAVLIGAVGDLQGSFITVLNVLSGLSLDETIDEFLKHAAPGEAQMKAWKEYRIVLAGGDDALYGKAADAIAKCIGMRV